MQKRLLTLALCAASVAAVSADNLYSSTFDTPEEVAGWAIFDSNGDDTTWKFSSTAESGSRFYYGYHSTNAANDWAISPAITPAADGKIMVRYQVKGSYYGEAVNVCYGSAQTPEAMTNVAAALTGLNSSSKGGYFIVDVKASVPVYIGFQAVSDADKYRLCLQSLSVSTLDGDPVDLALTEIKSPATGNLLNQESVVVTIKNAGEGTVDKFDVNFTTDKGQSVTESVSHALAKGESFDYTFTAKADLSETRRLYTVTAKVINSNDIDDTNNSKSVSVRNYADATVPYSMGFETSEDVSRIKFFNLNNDSGDWEVAKGSWYMNLARTGYGCIAYNYSKDNNADDWTILEPIHLEAGTYALKFWYSGSDGHTEKLKVMYGASQTPEAMTQTIVDLPAITQGEYQQSISFFEVKEAQTVYLGFYAYSDKDENWLSVDDVTLEQIDPNAIDIELSDLTAPGSYLPQADYKNVSFTIHNVSMNDSNSAVKVLVDDAVVLSKEESVRAQEKKVLTYEGALAGVAEGKHTVKVVVENSADTQLANNTLSADIIVLGTPSILYDFEDGRVPDSFRFYVKDDGSINASAVEEFGSTGWAAFPIEAHRLYGNYLLGATTWIDLSTDSEIYRMLVLPDVTVDSDDAVFAWNAGSLSDSYTLSYRMMVNDGTWGKVLDNRYYYDDLAVVKGQGSSRVNSGVSLSKYKGKTITVAFQLFGKPGDAVAFDNLQFHGCSLLSTGVKAVRPASGEITAVVADGKLVVKSAADVTSITVVDLSGRTVARDADLSVLPQGTYIVKVATTDGAAVVKVVK
jgi:hypothetical protein